MQNDLIKRIENDVQDRTSDAWIALCNYVDEVAVSGSEIFCPAKAIGNELYAQIYTLPESIRQLKQVKEVQLYGSRLKRIPPEIGEMESLENLDLYTSYSLHWLPYEIIHCKNLKTSRVSTRALYGNYKTRKGFPCLLKNPVRYMGDTVNCSVCGRCMSYAETDQLWISLEVGTDVLPLLANLCSAACVSKLRPPVDEYVFYPHKGGPTLLQPPDDWTRFVKEMEKDEWEQKERGERVVLPKEELSEAKGPEIAPSLNKGWFYKWLKKLFHS
ncbi:hypothetical protein HNQ91_001224 [Filimonas zeae]|nr:leucine-rich repeat domain-containing protein [Filimonas zeae]MDR6338202.1 hypothetical protein [Filimonas zeae]